MRATTKSFKCIQMIGTQRSGTNLLRLMLNELDEVIAPHPPHILKTFMPFVQKYPDLSAEENFRVLVNDVCSLIETNPVVWDHILLDRETVFSRCKSHALMEIFRVVYELMAEANHTSVWCCKSMANVQYVDEIESSGINPYYIHLVRDGRDVAASFKKVAVGDKHIFHLAAKWKKDQELSAQLVKKVGGERGITIRYEDLIADPETTMRSICGLIGVEYSSKVLNYFKSTECQHTAESGFMWHNLTKPILKGNTQKFKSALDPDEIELFEHVSNKVLLSNNYELTFENNSTEITPEMLDDFDRENDRLKNEIRKKKYLKVDISKRQKQENLIESIKHKLTNLNFIQS